VQDMAGNVWEWVDEIQVATSVARTANDEDFAYPEVVRSGSYGTPPVYPRTATRVFIDGYVRYGTVGFRCVRNWPGEYRVAPRETQPPACFALHLCSRTFQRNKL